MRTHIEPENYDRETKCPGCGFRYMTLYRLATESEEDAVCGDCFVGWLSDHGFEVVVD